MTSLNDLWKSVDLSKDIQDQTKRIFNGTYGIPLDTLLFVTVKDKNDNITYEKALFDGANFANEDAYYYYQLKKDVIEWAVPTEYKPVK